MESIPARLDGATVALTGATSGIGFFAARELSRLGASVVVLGRSVERSRDAISRFDEPGRHRFVPSDLRSPESVREAGSTLAALPELNAILLNAGVIDSPRRFEMGEFAVETTVGTNYLAHVELLRLALPALQRAPRARIVSVGSMLTRRIPFDPDNWLSQRAYRSRNAYAMSKHAAEIFGFELDRRLSRSTVESVVSHPGGAIDALTPESPGLRPRTALMRRVTVALAPLVSGLAQGKESASQSAVAAVADGTLRGGEYVGPQRIVSGPPVISIPVSSSTDPALGKWLWAETETLLDASILT